MTSNQDLTKKALLEGVIFASTHPMSVRALAELLETESSEIETMLGELEQEYAGEGHGMALLKVAGGYQFRTKENLKIIMAKLNAKKPPRLTQATLEVLSIIAYKEPIIRPEIERIRGVDCTGVLQTLLERELVEMRGRSNLPGNPVIYGTTPKFLEWFQIGKLSDLPPLSEVDALNKNFHQGADNLLGLLNRDDGFTSETMADMDETLKKVSSEIRDPVMPWEEVQPAGSEVAAETHPQQS